MPDDVKGVLVTDVAADSVGYDVGLRKGDVILDMDRKALTSADEAVTRGTRSRRLSGCCCMSGATGRRSTWC